MERSYLSKLSISGLMDVVPVQNNINNAIYITKKGVSAQRNKIRWTKISYYIICILSVILVKTLPC